MSPEQASVTALRSYRSYSSVLILLMRLLTACAKSAESADFKLWIVLGGGWLHATANEYLQLQDHFRFYMRGFFNSQSDAKKSNSFFSSYIGCIFNYSRLLPDGHVVPKSSLKCQLWNYFLKDALLLSGNKTSCYIVNTIKTLLNNVFENTIWNINESTNVKDFLIVAESSVFRFENNLR